MQDTLLTTKSIHDYTDTDNEQIHNNELESILNNFLNFEEKNCELYSIYIDPYHSKKMDPTIQIFSTYDIHKFIGTCDIKNGVDIFLDENYRLVIITYGTGYHYKDKFNIVTKKTYIVLPEPLQREFEKSVIPKLLKNINNQKD